jgi:hypothetical protein
MIWSSIRRIKPVSRAKNQNHSGRLWHGQHHPQYKMALELPPNLRASLYFLIYCILCKQLQYEFHCQPYSCRLPSTSLMLFLHALLFFVLGTGTSALAAGSKKPDHSLSVPIREGMEDDKVYERAQGYWRPQVRTKNGSFHVSSFEKLNLDRTGLISSILLWHILARVDYWCLMPAIVPTSMLHAMGSAFLCGY